jgi:hypothetical protein
VTWIRLAGLAAILAGLAWIPIRIAISVTFSEPFLDLSYVEWNRLMVISLGLQLVALLGGLLTVARTHAGRIGVRIAAAGMIGMLAGVLVEFWVFGGLVGDREGAIAGWMIYLLAGVLVHVIGMVTFGVGSLRAGLVPIGGLAVGIGALHVAWIPAALDARLLVADQVLIGLGWVAIGVLLLIRAAAGSRPLRP